MIEPDLTGWPVVSDDDLHAVTELLGRRPEGDFAVVVRHDDGSPRVIKNAPVLREGRPMPTLYWLVSSHDRLVVSRLESTGAVTEAEAAVGLEAIAKTHDDYRRERDALIPATYDGHRPTGGVGGTRVGLKCLHAHYAHYLVHGDDPVGAWVAARLDEQGVREPATVSEADQ